MNILYNIESQKLDYVKNINIVEQIYYQQIRVPRTEDIQNYKYDDKFIVMFKENMEIRIQKIKDEISLIDTKIPLYDVYSNNLYVISKEQVLNKVTNDHFRFPTSNIIKAMRMELDRNSKKTNERIKKRLTLMLSFLDNFNLKILYETYSNIFKKLLYDKLGYITSCIKPSFIPIFGHINPYYEKKEIINMLLNMKLKDSKKIIDQINEKNDISTEICNKVIQNDISNKILQEHYNYIIGNEKKEFMIYYTFNGAYFMNNYLRHINSSYKNVFIEYSIFQLKKLIDNSPAFDNKYIVYRFINDDIFLKNIKPGEIFLEKGFMSTTRDLFYKLNYYNFGDYLMKIIIPANKKGVALCNETISVFPKEEEILFSCYSKFKLIKKHDDVKYYFMDKIDVIKTVYVFKYINKIKKNKDIKIDKKENVTDKQFSFITEPIITKNKIQNKIFSANTLAEKIDIYINEIANKNGQYIYKDYDDSGTKKITYYLNSEWYDGAGVYSEFYKNRSSSGFSISLMEKKKNTYLMIMELYDIISRNCLAINYSFKKFGISKELHFNIINSFALLFGINDVYIYGNYFNKENNIINQDIYEYITLKKKRFNIVEITPLFSYKDIDLLQEYSPSIFINKNYKDELYYVYTTKFLDGNIYADTIYDFYKYIVTSYVYLYNVLVDHIMNLNIFKINNPFQNVCYKYDYQSYLYNNNIIKTLNMDLYYSKNKILLKNNYRLEYIK